MAYQDTFKRLELKYLLDRDQYLALRKSLTGRGIAATDSYGETQIMNIYYDTPDWRLIRTSLDKPAYKEKLRLRTYGTPAVDGSTPAFIEIKKKFDGIVYKRRVSLPYREAAEYLDRHRGRGRREELSVDGSEQILSEIDYCLDYYRGLAPAMIVSYDRIAMAGIKDKNLRITFDAGIRWRTDRMDLRAGGDGTQILAPGQRLMELKIAGAIPVELAELFDELEIRTTSFSKYGQGFLMMRRMELERRQRVYEDDGILYQEAA